MEQSENYIVINGKKVEFTEEQLKQLGINVEEKEETPYDYNDDFDNVVYNNVNYFNDYKFARQVALHQLLYCKLLKYAYTHDAISDWANLNSKKYFIAKSIEDNKFYVYWNLIFNYNCVVYFNSKEVAEQAIEDVIKPFMEEYPEFVW